MQDDVARAERYDSLVTSIRLTAQHAVDEKRREELLSLANQYQVLADSIARRRNGSDVP